MVLFLFFWDFIFYMKGRIEREMERQTDLPSVGSLLKWLQQSGSGQAEARNQRFPLDLLPRSRDERTWLPLLHLSQVHSRKMNWK